MSIMGLVSKVTTSECGYNGLDDNSIFKLEIDIKDEFEPGNARFQGSKDGRVSSSDSAFHRTVRKRLVNGKGVKFLDFKKLVTELTRTKKAAGWIPYVVLDEEQRDEIELLNVDCTPRADNMTSLIYSCCLNDLNYVRKMINSGANVNLRYHTGATALMEAAYSAEHRVVQALLKAGAKKNAQNEDGYSPLMIAAQRGRLESVKALVECGADPNIKTKHKYTALMLAVRYNRTDVTVHLVEHGKANVLEEDADGLTAMCWASIHSSNDSFYYLLSVIMQRNLLQTHVKRRVKLMRKGIRNPNVYVALTSNVVSLAILSDARDVMFEASIFECLMKIPPIPNCPISKSILLAQFHCLVLLGYCMLYNDQRFIDVYVTTEPGKILMEMLNKPRKFTDEDARFNNTEIVHLCAIMASICANVTSMGRQWVYDNCKLLVKSFDFIDKQNKLTCNESSWTQFLRAIQVTCTEFLELYKAAPKAFGRPIPRRSLENCYGNFSRAMVDTYVMLRDTISEANMKTLLQEEEENKRRAEKKREKKKTQKRKRKGPSEDDNDSRVNDSFTDMSSTAEKHGSKCEVSKQRHISEDVVGRSSAGYASFSAAHSDHYEFDLTADAFTVQMSRKQKRAAKKAASDPDEFRIDVSDKDEFASGAWGGAKSKDSDRSAKAMTNNAVHSRKEVTSTKPQSRPKNTPRSKPLLAKTDRVRSPIRSESANTKRSHKKRPKEQPKLESKPEVVRNRSPLKIVESNNPIGRHVEIYSTCKSVHSPIKKNKTEDPWKVCSPPKTDKKQTFENDSSPCLTPRNDSLCDVVKWVSDDDSNINAQSPDQKCKDSTKMQHKELPCLSPKFQDFIPQKLVFWNDNKTSPSTKSVPLASKHAWVGIDDIALSSSKRLGRRTVVNEEPLFVDPCLYPYNHSLNNLNAPGISTPSSNAFIGDFMPSLYDGVSFCSCERSFRSRMKAPGIHFASDLERHQMQCEDDTLGCKPFSFTADEVVQSKINNTSTARDAGFHNHKRSCSDDDNMKITNNAEAKLDINCDNVDYNIKATYYDKTKLACVDNSVSRPVNSSGSITKELMSMSLTDSRVGHLHPVAAVSQNEMSRDRSPHSNPYAQIALPVAFEQDTISPIRALVRNLDEEQHGQHQPPKLNSRSAAWNRKKMLPSGQANSGAGIQPPPGFESCFSIITPQNNAMVPSLQNYTQLMPRVSRSQRWQHVLGVLVEKKGGVTYRVGNMLTCTQEDVFCLHKNDETKCMVFLGVRADGIELAIKRIPIALESGVDELKFIGNVKHENIIKFLECTNDENFLYVGMELGEYTLNEYIHKLNVEGVLHQKSRYLVVQLLQGLHAIHCAFFMHLNLKPENILIDVHGVLKIAGFTRCKQMREGELSVAAPLPKASCIWRSTESFVMNCGNKSIMSRVADVQVAGMLVHYIATGGQHPFGGPEVKQITNNIRDGRMMSCHVADDALFHLLGWMLHPNPEQRKTVADCLLHPYFWADKRRFSFLQKVGEELDRGCSYDNTDVLLELNAVQQWTGYTNWAKLVDDDILEATSRYGYFYEDTGTDLVRFMSHVEKHLVDMPPSIRHEVRDPWLYFKEKTPQLFLAVYDVVQRNGGWTCKECLKEFFRKDDI